MDVFALNDDVAEIDADAEIEPRSGGASAFRFAFSCWISTAQRNASITLWNSTSMPSPIVLTSRP